MSAPVDVLAVMDRWMHDLCATGTEEMIAAREVISAVLVAAREVDAKAEHHHAGCTPGPMKRMPPELRAAILGQRAALARVQP